MFERYLTDALTKHFGHLVEDVDAEQVRLSAWNGRLALHDIFLKTNALDGFVDQCPVEIAYGKVGRLDVQVPWALLGSQLWSRKTTKNPDGEPDQVRNSENNVSITLNDVNILITPRRMRKVDDNPRKNGSNDRETIDDKMDEDKVRRKTRERKEKVVQELLDAQLFSRVALSSRLNSRWKWLQELLSDLLSNLTITAQNIHIRYEDPGHSMGFVWHSQTGKVRRYRKEFAIGITLGDFSVTTTAQKDIIPTKDSPNEEDSTKSALTSEVSVGSDDSQTTSKKQELAPQDESSPNLYTVSSKVATAKHLSIYWDSDGCFLMSIGREEREVRSNISQTQRSYCEQAFSVLNRNDSKGKSMEGFPDTVRFQIPHTYLLDPVSPSARFDFVTEREHSTEKAEPPKLPTISSKFSVPSSSISITLPPTLFAVSKQTLEDTTYLRKSLDAWMHAKKGILSDRTLRRLASLRPMQSPAENPRGWWKYATEATIAFIQVGRQQDAIHGEASSQSNNEQPHRSSKKRGWIGLARALRKRRQYVLLYKELYTSDAGRDSKSETEPAEAVMGPEFPPQQRIHQALLKLEDELTASEIAAFRLSAYKEVVEDTHARVSADGAILMNESQPNPVDDDKYNRAPKLPTEFLSLEHRYKMFAEMAEALEQEKENTDKIQQEESTKVTEENMPSTQVEQDPVAWKVSLSCAQLALQVNDRYHEQVGTKHDTSNMDILPIARLSCACLLRSDLHRSQSWNIDGVVAGLTMEDLTHQDTSETGTYGMRMIIGPKLAGHSGGHENFVDINGTPFLESIHVGVRRNRSFGQMGYTTFTNISLSPLEIIYSTVPFESILRVLSTVKTPELADDYYRMAGRVYEWREMQKKRLLQALAHKEKIMVVDVNVAAPVVLIPETLDKAESPMMIIDLGQLSFSNATKQDDSVAERDEESGFDDAWQLRVKNIQMQCSTTKKYRSADGSGQQQQLVESFSLELSILTQVSNNGDEARIKIAANLPRLSFNISSSSLQLTSRLRSQWSQRKKEVKTGRFGSRNKLPPFGETSPTKAARIERCSPSSPLKEPTSLKRYFQFDFSAPLITLKLQNDVDVRAIPGRASSAQSTSIVSISIRGIGGQVLQKKDASGNAVTRFEARLHSLLAIDHYQTAGIEFSPLLSSLEPTASLLSNDWFENGLFGIEQRDLPLVGNDLVLVQYLNEDGGDDSSLKGSKLEIQFHELFVEWNPETLAALHRAVRTPAVLDVDDDEVSKATDEADAFLDDEFYDAEEEIFFDSSSNYAQSPYILKTPLMHLTRESTISFLSPVPFPTKPFPFDDEAAPPFRKLEVIFNLSKLRVNFNKDSRFRRLFSCEMARTFVKYQTQESGGSKTFARLGNLIVSDPSTVECQTLYGQILGLKSSTYGGNSSELSLFEVEIVSNQKDRQEMERHYKREDPEADSPRVSLCYSDGSVRGADTHITAHLSPMRFVYLSQLWSEVVDYFFEGIIGYEVMGKTRPKKQDESDSCSKEDIDAPIQRELDVDPTNVSFTKFSITILSPEVLFPVTYRSPQFLKLAAAGIKISNFFECKCRGEDVARWHNNCTISFQALRIFSWDNKELSHSKTSVGAKIDLRWPLGPLAPREVPKWNVRCNLDSLHFTFRRDDYALLQNVVSYNISEESRNLDEWNALQNLSADYLKQYKSSILVHYGYDSKDVAPTTYSIALEMPLVSLSLESGNGTIVGVASCSKFSWRMRKGSNRISRQQIKCKIELLHPRKNNQGQILLSANQSRVNESDSKPELDYSSTSDPAGNNVKSLEITDACINMFYPGWITLSRFFSNLPEAEVFTPEQVSTCVQVGDRWYNITKSTGRKVGGAEDANNASQRNFSWMGKEEGFKEKVAPNNEVKEEENKTSFQLRILLTSPSVVLSCTSSEGETKSVILRLRHLDFLHSAVAGETTKSFFLHDLELNTSSHVDRNEGENSLIQPVSVAGMSESCNGEKCSFDTHSFRLHVGMLRARAAFSDLMITINVFLHLVSDIRQSQVQKSIVSSSASKGDNSLQIVPKHDELPSRNKVEASESKPNQKATVVNWEGFEFLVVDDSGRHFAGSQELITLSLRNIQFWRDERLQKNKSRTNRMTVRLEKLNMLDCLQPEASPFRIVATIRPDDVEIGDIEESTSFDKISWKDFAIIEAEKWGFCASSSFMERLSLRPFPVDNFMDSARRVKPSITLDSFEDSDSLQTYNLTVGVSKIQYNPSTVIAMQRFMGRFRKQATASIDAFHEEVDKLMEESYGAGACANNTEDSVPTKPEVEVRVALEAKQLSVDLNKEHQHRRLLRLTLSDCHATMRRKMEFWALEGSVSDLSAWDCDLNWKATDERDNTTNLCVLRSAKGQTPSDPKFIQFRYCLNPNTREEIQIPEWVQNHAISGNREDIDDCLEVSLSAVEFTYLRERTEELVDYLSNGLPGKGMGATSKAAQGFLEKRIQTRSFLHVLVQSPSVLIPEHKFASAGIRLQLGDIDLNSWFEGGSSTGRINEIDLGSSSKALIAAASHSSKPVDGDTTDWWRMLSLKISNFSAGIFESRSGPLKYDNFLNRPLDLSLILQKSAWHHKPLTVRCKASLVDMTLRYSHYCRIQSALKFNVGEEIDQSRWSNVEKEYDREVKEAESRATKPVEYASGARHVRFGNPQGENDSSYRRDASKVADRLKRKSLVDVQFLLDGIRVIFRRDDDPVVNGLNQREMFEYDMILAKVHRVEVSVCNIFTDEYSYKLAFHRIGVFDVGDLGRLEREKLDGRKVETRRPCAFAILVEGYSSMADHEQTLVEDDHHDNDLQPQLLISMDRIPASSAGTIGSKRHSIEQVDENGTVKVVKCVLNYLSVNALIRPFTELGTFLALGWSDPSTEALQADIAPERTKRPTDLEASTSSTDVVSKQRAGDFSPDNNKIESETNSLQFKLVANYPRIFFVADESDAQSRALVLRGLVIVNAGRTKKTDAEGGCGPALGVNREDIQNKLVVDAHLQSLESYINADVSKALRVKERHIDEHESLKRFQYSGDHWIDDTDELGIALLQPVTAAIEYCNLSRLRFPSRRFLSVNVEPISTMVSFDDLTLLESVVNRWVRRSTNATKKLDKETEKQFSNGIKSKPSGPEEHCRVKRWTLEFKSGTPNGISFENSTVAGMPVVTAIAPCISTAIVGSKGSKITFPKTGALITELNGKGISGTGFEDAAKLVSNHGLAADASDTCNPFYSITFLEIQSQWVTLDSLELSLQGGSLTFIDDLSGRDMPMLRGSLNSAELHVEKGLGIGTFALGKIEELSFLKYDNLHRTDINADGSLSLRANARVSMDYFHPRLAEYEPLLEPAPFFLSYERHNKNDATGRAGQVALELSDHLLRNPENGQPLGSDHQQPLICVNISDSSVEVLSKALREWGMWRQMVKKSSPLSTVSSMPSGRGVISLPPEESALDERNEYASATEGQAQQQNQAVATSAAQAAFLFAQRRGGDKSGNEAKSGIIFRNRLGVSIAFVQQDSTKQSKTQRKRSLLQPQQSFVGEYLGLENYNRADITELADGDDELFQMNVSGHHEAKTKVRSYDHLPCLTVAVQAISGVTVEAITDLQVQKAGCSIRHLSVLKSTSEMGSSDGEVKYSVPFVWRVEVDDNRRILTLSSAVQVVSLNSTVGIEIGVEQSQSLPTSPIGAPNDVDTFKAEKNTPNDNADGRPSSNEVWKRDDTRLIGTALPGVPFYLPIWLSMRRELVSIFVRPKFGSPSASYDWGQQSVLKYGPSETLSVPTWEWQGNLDEGLASIQCLAKVHSAPPAFLSCFSTALVPNQNNQTGLPVDTLGAVGHGERPTDILSICVDSGLSLQNLLPFEIEWEAAHGFDQDLLSAVDGSTVRFRESTSETTALRSGECADVYACNFKLELLKARFKLKDMQGWSEWAIVSSPKIAVLSSHESAENGSEATESLSPSQVNVQITDSFGVPVTLGVRVIPKVARVQINETNMICYGVDVVVYAELWISNVTTLPLTFGCPEEQLHGKADDGKDGMEDEEASKFSAEAALMEMASVLEVGNKGAQMDTRTAEKAATAGGLHILPQQQGREIVEEIFEFLEIESSTVKRRWWGSDCYWNLRNSEFLNVSDKGCSWHWIDEGWKIDRSGNVERSGGWESCKDLLGIGEGPFSGLRAFHPSDPIRRRRWFRSRAGNSCSSQSSLPTYDQETFHENKSYLLPGLQAFHHPIHDSFSMSQRKAKQRKNKKTPKSSEVDGEGTKIELASANTYKIAIKCGGGKWSETLTLSSLGTNHGCIKVFASRWLKLTNSLKDSQPEVTSDFSPVANTKGVHAQFGRPSLSPAVYELVYHVTEVEGEWGEFSRHMMISARFSVRNDSKQIAIEIKQAGTNDGGAVKLMPGQIAPFYWSDFSLPHLVCVRPASTNNGKQRCYKWSGGFDPQKLGMASLLIRLAPTPASGDNFDNTSRVRSIRTLVELRPGTGGNGFNISFKEESEDGDGALYRIENLSTFNVWLAQDGVLANPSMTVPHDTTEQDGDVIRPGERFAFGLEVPFRQGKYAHRKPATMAELLRVRVGLAPLSSRAGIETTKVVGLSVVGESVRLNPSKLVAILTPSQRKTLETIRILAVTTVDGPSRVLKFCLMAYPPVDVLGSSLMESVSYAAPTDEVLTTGPHANDIKLSASRTQEVLLEKSLPNEMEAKRQAHFGSEDLSGNISNDLAKATTANGDGADQYFSIRLAFVGFIISLIDASPSEICTLAVENISAVSKWNQSRTSDASLLLSIGWVQMDNHVPSAPFAVAVCPEGIDSRQGKDGSGVPREPTPSPPLLFIGVEIAPEHSSGIVCLKSVTVALRNISVSLDLAFLVRMQRYASGLQGHFRPQRKATIQVPQTGREGFQLLYKRAMQVPDIRKKILQMKDAAATGVGRQQIYFSALAILPFSIKLSVAPARALTTAQAAFEGAEAEAIHKAVRKGDFLVGRNTNLGVILGRKNKTALAVVQGVFKSIVVDALIRLDGASLNLSGAFLRNQIFYGPQLATYLGAHYLFSLRQNVPNLVGSMAAFGNPLGLFRGLGDGVNDFVAEPVKGIKKSIAKQDPKYIAHGVAKGTESLARHTVGGFADSAALLTSTFSKNMAVLTLDRHYAQKRDRGINLQLEEQGDFVLLDGFESGFVKLAQGFIDGVTGVVKAPMRGAARNGLEGFAKGLGKGLLGLLVKPMIGISDAATDVFIGLKSSVDGDGHKLVLQRQQIRPRRALYGREKQLRAYNIADAAACALMLRTSIGGESFLSHLDMDDRVALCSDQKLLLLDSEGQKLLLVRFKQIASVELREFGGGQWTVLLMLDSNEIQAIDSIKTQDMAQELANQIKHAMRLLEIEV